MGWLAVFRIIIKAIWGWGDRGLEGAVPYCSKVRKKKKINFCFSFGSDHKLFGTEHLGRRETTK